MRSPPEPTPDLLRARERWRYTGRVRPSWAHAPGPGQESVWDYPRPPRLEREPRRVRVEFAGKRLADTLRALRVLETAGAPTLYLPRPDVCWELLVPGDLVSLCEWKGEARHWTVRVSDRESLDAGWSYAEPFRGFEALRDHVAFHPARVDRCRLGEVDVAPQPGGYYGGWITPDVAGPFKGEPGTEDW